MAPYFHGSPEIQPDGLQTLYLMNPGFVGYSDPPAPPANMVFLNPMSTSQGVQPNQQQHFVSVPLHAAALPSQDADRFSSIHSSHEISAIQGLVPRLHYNLLAPPPPNNPMDLSSQLGLRQQALSLSLSPQQTQYERYRPQPETPALVTEITLASAEEARIPGTSSPSMSATPNGISGMQSVLMGSNYLKAAQQLLDEVAYVGTGINGQPSRGADSMNRAKPNMDGDHPDAAGTDTKQGAELTAAERQELQMKKAKLVSMLDEVEQRYRQYHHQMQIVVSWFESAAGFGSARTYTALALQTISKQFRCLRDAISGQIRATSRSLGDEDCPGGAKSQEPRLRSVDRHLRQQRALQQLAMMQHNAWRPQRGLPERAVSVLRAWLFEHFLHPYPKDSDKLILAKQTGLTRSQVSNWFINARVRLWKPMVEEMYLEETKEQEQTNQGERSSKSDANEEDSKSKSSARQENSPAIADQTDPQLPPINGSYNDSEALMQHKIKKARSDESLHRNTVSHSMMNEELRSTERSNQEMLMSFGDERRRSEGNHGYSLISAPGDHGGGFGAYSIGEIGRFDQQQFTPRLLGNGVSLTLGLQHCEGLSLSGSQPAYLSSESIPMGRRDEMISSESNGYRRSLSNIPPVAHASDAYEAINIQSRKRFAAQLLPDFVA